MAKDLAGKVVVVTGSAFGIGRAISLRAAAQGAMVVIADVPGEEGAGKRTATECEVAGSPKSMYVACDVSKGPQVAALMQAAANECGSIDVVYANAGVGGIGPGKWAHEVSEEDFMQVVAINLCGVFHAAKYSLPYLVKSQGVLINTGSTFGMVGSHYAPAYCASKGGVINLTRQLAVDYGPLGVRVLAICPGYVSNWMGHSVGMGNIGDLPDVGSRALAPEVTAKAAQSRWETRAGAAEQQPLARMCSPDEIASVIPTWRRASNLFDASSSAIAMRCHDCAHALIGWSIGAGCNLPCYFSSFVHDR
jgi:NAD(P)-dependent dehydrogenase (short-subunit alcohol dehydrogenase family)